ncbi:LUD domain-containing protein [Polaribacter sp. MSW13]|uniref:LUD domain-containing protein n=1 Tax=Polaribacter marinus TaxID=2916838 RepID=A0A9X2AL19_9FLAO|nr:LUD domain-containing protein [Polaribacter marinus]MCI2230098.1 LUD domain-containing protein [Polaribacter marinus]
MKLFKKIFNFSIKETKEIQSQEVNLSLDDLFVHNFIEKGGKFLYCLKKDEVIANLKSIISENNWSEILILDKNLSSFFKKEDVKIIESFNSKTPILTTCEHLIADNGDILFSSNQLKSKKFSELSENFIVYATTSQLVKDTSQGLTGIKTNNKENLPTNISAIKNYNLNKSEDNFLNYGNSNSKNLYLLLLEDL